MENDPHDSASPEAEAAASAEDPVTVSLGPMGFLFRQLRSAIDWQYSRLMGVQAEIQILGEGLEGLCTDLKNLSHAEDTMTICWARQVRDLCYDAEDYLDELMHFIHNSGTRPRTRRPSMQNRHGSKIFPVSLRLRLSLTKVKKLKRVPLIAKLSALVARVEDADERRKRFKIAPPQASKLDCSQGEAVSPLMPQLALQPHVNKLIKLLGFHNEQNERNLKVVTIFGSAGVGKTAVASTLYHKFRARFQYRAFLRVSRDTDMRSLLADLLSQIKAPPAHAFSDVQGLIAAITKLLQGKSYFIVIDDLWDTSTWDIINHALPDGDYCRIITTTQIEDVAQACCSDELKYIYEINHLKDDLSGTSEDGFIAYPSTEEMKQSLNLAYNNLPPHLKTCLLYLNIYPEGWTVKKGELVKLWVAEGFIRSVQAQDLEETAGFYFDALVSRGMVQSVDTGHEGDVLSCTLHHMVLDLIRQKSMEENFVTIVNYFQTIIGLPDKVRRLSVQLGSAKGANNISANMRISQVRSLIFCGFFKSVPSIMEYGLLQVLILHIWSDQDGIFDLTKIGDLYRLRYLKIDCSITVKLPHKIRRLQQLGTLQVDARLHAVPSDIVHLERLLHLCLRSESILPHGVGRMTRLRTLGSFDLGSNSEDNVRDLGELENLQDLQLTCSAVQQAESLEKNVQLLLGSVLRKLSRLQSVTLVPAAGPSNDSLHDGAGASRMCISSDGSSIMSPAPAHIRRLKFSRRCCIFSRFPRWLGDLAKLCILKIAVGELLKEDVVILSGLPSLASLSLHVAPRSIEKVVFGKEGFTVLRYFKFTCTTPWLEFEEEAMPNLEKLKLCFNSPIVDEQGTTRIIIVGRLLGLKEFTAIIGSAGADAESAWWKAIRNDPSNPEVQLTGPIYYGHKGRRMVTREGSGVDGYSETDIRVWERWWIEEEYISPTTQNLIQEEHLPSEQPRKIKESDEDINQNVDSESAASLSVVVHPDMKLNESIIRLELKELTPRKTKLKEAHDMVLVLAIFAASMTYQVGLKPPPDGHQAGSTILLTMHARRYIVFFYCNSVAFVSSLVVIATLPSKYLRPSFIHKINILEAAMKLDLLSLVAAYTVGCCRDVRTSLQVIALGAVVLVYILIHMVFFTVSHSEQDKTLKKMHKLLLAILAGTISYQAELTPPRAFRSSEEQEEDKTMKNNRKLLLLLAIGVATTTYQSGVTLPWVLATYPRRYAAFFYCNATSFMSSIAVIIILLNPNLYKFAIQCNVLYVCTVASLLGVAGTFGSSRHMRTLPVGTVVLVVVSIFSVSLTPLAFWLLRKKSTREEGLVLGKNEASTECTMVEDKDLFSSARNQPTTGRNKDEGQSDDKKTPRYTIREYMLIVAILVAAAALTPPGGVWLYSNDGLSAVDSVLRDINKRLYGLFFDSNSVLLRASVLVILLLLLDEQIDLRRLRVGDRLVRLRAFLRRAAQYCHPRVIFML